MDQKSLANVCLAILAAMAVTIALIYTRSMMIPFVLSVFITMAVLPILEFFERRARMPHGLAIATTILAVMVIWGLVSLMVVLNLRELLQNIEVYRQKLGGLLQLTLTTASQFGIELDGARMREMVLELPVFDTLKGMAGGAVGLISDTVLVMIFVGFLVPGAGFRFREGSMSLEVYQQIRVYVVTKGLASLGTGILTAGLLLILGLDMAVMFGVLAFFLNFIPTVGSLVAMLIPIPVALLQFDEIWRTVLVLALPGSVQFVIGNIVEPKIMGDTLQLHPVTLLLTLMFWGLVWGIPGMFLAVPLTVVMKIGLEKSPFSGLAELMAGRVPSLSKGES